LFPVPRKISQGRNFDSQTYLKVIVLRELCFYGSVVPIRQTVAFKNKNKLCIPDITINPVLT
jgi:hypothetical protein